MRTRPLLSLVGLSLSLSISLSLSACNKPHASATANSSSSASSAQANATEPTFKIADQARQDLEKAKSVEKEFEKAEAERKKAIDEAIK
jgi:hypothetical protein